MSFVSVCVCVRASVCVCFNYCYPDYLELRKLAFLFKIFSKITNSSWGRGSWTVLCKTCYLLNDKMDNHLVSDSSHVIFALVPENALVQIIVFEPLHIAKTLITHA